MATLEDPRKEALRQYHLSRGKTPEEAYAIAESATLEPFTYSFGNGAPQMRSPSTPVEQALRNAVEPSASGGSLADAFRAYGDRPLASGAAIPRALTQNDIIDSRNSGVASDLYGEPIPPMDMDAVDAAGQRNHMAGVRMSQPDLSQPEFVNAKYRLADLRAKAKEIGDQNIRNQMYDGKTWLNPPDKRFYPSFQDQFKANPPKAVTDKLAKEYQGESIPADAIPAATIRDFAAANRDVLNAAAQGRRVQSQGPWRPQRSASDVTSEAALKEIWAAARDREKTAKENPKKLTPVEQALAERGQRRAMEREVRLNGPVAMALGGGFGNMPDDERRALALGGPRAVVALQQQKAQMGPAMLEAQTRAKQAEDEAAYRNDPKNQSNRLREKGVPEEVIKNEERNKEDEPPEDFEVRGLDRVYINSPAKRDEIMRFVIDDDAEGLVKYLRKKGMSIDKVREIIRQNGLTKPGGFWNGWRRTPVEVALGVSAPPASQASINVPPSREVAPGQPYIGL